MTETTAAAFDFSFTGPNLLRYGLPIAAAWLISLLAVWACIVIARRWKLLDQPGPRSSHETPTPRLGGAGIGIGFFCAWALAATWRPDEPIGTYFSPGAVFDRANNPAFAMAAILGALIALAFGLVDDVRGIGPLAKFGCQFLCAGLAAFVFGIRPQGVEIASGLAAIHPAIGAILTFLAVVFFMNAVNFMDGMNGHAGTFGVLACAGLALPILLGRDFGPGHELRASILILLLGALLGFLRFNLAREASIFMGDAGSQMIGYLLAIQLAASNPRFLLSNLLVLWPFIFDTGFTLLSRTIRGKNLLQAHREHFYQTMLKAGLSHSAALRWTILLHLVCLAGAAYYVVLPGGVEPGRALALAWGAALLATVAYGTGVTFYGRVAMKNANSY